MTDQTDCRQPSQISLREKRVLTGVFIFLVGYIVYLTVFSPAPKFYSFEEYARAKVACGGDASEDCQIRELKAWRKANPDAPRGDSSRG